MINAHEQPNAALASPVGGPTGAGQPAAAGPTGSRIQLLRGDCRQVLDTLPDNSVQCCVTSPPYWGLRSYLSDGHPEKHLEIGSEPTVDEWVDTMVDVFRRVRRVLRDDGVLFLNLGDAYVHGTGADRGPTTADGPNVPASWSNRSQPQRIRPSAGLKTKDLIGQPWMAAFALRADGWWLRQEIIWHKPNPMPESARDRCTKAHEHIFLLSKSDRYFWNFDAVQERAISTAPSGNGFAGRQGGARGLPMSGGAGSEDRWQPGGTRNPRSVWSFPTEAFKGAHFATFPRELARRCIQAGTREGDTVLDPFGGSGTVGLVADAMHRRAVLIDLDERNLPMAHDRIAGDAPLFANITT